MSKTTIHSFVPIQKLGEGTFSSVYKVRRISDNKIYALKKIKMASLKEKEKANALNQIRILASLCSEHIVTYKQAFFDQQLKLLCIVMECANEGDLLQKINKAKSAHTYIEQREIWKAIYQILTGLMTLHKNNILHRDLKSANIFVNDGNFKIGDLNVSKINADEKLVKTQTGTPYYASPQIWRDQPYNHKSDIWSFGCIIYQICCLQPPFQGDSLDQLYKNIQKGYFPKISERYSQQLMELIAQCLSLKTDRRPNADQLLKNGGIVISKCQFYQIKTVAIQSVDKKQPLLSTIKMPFDINSLNKKLPHSKYDGQGNKANSLPAKALNIQSSAKIKQTKREINDNKITVQNKDKQRNLMKQKQNLVPLPQRIKSHLIGMAQRNINDVTAHRRPKTRIQTALVHPQNLLQHKLPNFSSIIPSISINKKRPLSCDIKKRLNSQPTHISRPITALQQTAKKVVTTFQQQKKGLICLQKDKIQYRRKITTQQSYVGYDYKGGMNKERCRSAILKNDSNNSREPVISSYFEIRKRLENRQKQMHSSQHYSAQKNNSYVSKTPLKQNQGKYRQIFSQKLPPLITKQAYLKNLKQNRQQNSLGQENKSYLMEIQNKLLGSSTSKAKKCSYMFSNQFLNVQQTKLKQLLRQQNIFLGKYNV